MFFGMHAHVPLACLVPWKVRKGSRVSAIGGNYLFEPTFECWYVNSGPLIGEQVILTTEAFLELLIFLLIKRYFLIKLTFIMKEIVFRDSLI